jgi:hypothetical protein
LVVDEAPLAILLDEDVGGREMVVVRELFFAEHDGDVAVEEGGVVMAHHMRRCRVLKDAAPALEHGAAARERDPAGMRAADRRAPRPERFHARHVLGREGVVERQVCGEDGVLFAVAHVRQGSIRRVRVKSPLEGVAGSGKVQ